MESFHTPFLFYRKLLDNILEARQNIALGNMGLYHWFFSCKLANGTKGVKIYCFRWFS